jgi:integrase/recombinase XerD
MEEYLNGFAIYLTEEKALMSNSITSYIRDIEAFFRFMRKEGIEGPESVSKTTILAYVYEEASSGKSSTSIARSLSSIRALFKYLIKVGVLTDNVAEGVSAPRADKSERAAVSVEDANKLLDKVGKKPIGVRDRAMLELVYTTGIRASAITELSVEDVNLNIGSVIIKDRQVMLKPAVKEVLKHYLEYSRPVLVGNKDTNVLFLNCNGSKMSRQGFWKNIKKYAKRAGIEPTLSPRTLRGVSME